MHPSIVLFASLLGLAIAAPQQLQSESKIPCSMEDKENACPLGFFCESENEGDKDGMRLPIF